MRRRSYMGSSPSHGGARNKGRREHSRTVWESLISRRVCARESAAWDFGLKLAETYVAGSGRATGFAATWKSRPWTSDDDDPLKQRLWSTAGQVVRRETSTIARAEAAIHAASGLRQHRVLRRSYTATVPRQETARHRRCPEGYRLSPRQSRAPTFRSSPDRSSRSP